MATLEGGERREGQRAKLAFDLRVEAQGGDHKLYTGLIRDISGGGLFVATGAPPKIGEVVTIRFAFPPVVTEPIEVRVRVRWLRPDSGKPDFPEGCGVQFLDLPEDVAQRINSYISQHDVLLHEEDDEFSEWGTKDL